MDAQSALVFGNGSDRELRLNLLTPEREKSLFIAMLQLHFGGWRMGEMMGTRKVHFS